MLPKDSCNVTPLNGHHSPFFPEGQGIPCKRWKRLSKNFEETFGERSPSPKLLLTLDSTPSPLHGVPIASLLPSLKPPRSHVIFHLLFSCSFPPGWGTLAKNPGGTRPPNSSHFSVSRARVISSSLEEMNLCQEPPGRAQATSGAASSP